MLTISVLVKLVTPAVTEVSFNNTYHRVLFKVTHKSTTGGSIHPSSVSYRWGGATRVKGRAERVHQVMFYYRGRSTTLASTDLLNSRLNVDLQIRSNGRRTGFCSALNPEHVESFPVNPSSAGRQFKVVILQEHVLWFNQSSTFVDQNISYKVAKLHFLKYDFFLFKITILFSKYFSFLITTVALTPPVKSEFCKGGLIILWSTVEAIIYLKLMCRGGYFWGLIWHQARSGEHL